jgi:hypothetical protein
MPIAIAVVPVPLTLMTLASPPTMPPTTMPTPLKHPPLKILVSWMVRQVFNTLAILSGGSGSRESWL